MDQPGFLASLGEDRQLHPPPAGRMADASCPEQEIRYASQPRVHPHEPVATQVDSAFLFHQRPAFQHYLDQQSRLILSNNDSQTSPAQNRALNNLQAKILNHPGIATYRDTVSNYLRLSPSLWTELYKPQFSSPAHHLLARYLVEEYGRLPADLWALIDELREQQQFGHLQDQFVNTISSIVTSHNLPQTPLESSGHDGRSLGGYSVGSALHPSEETSPILFQISSPVPGRGSQTAATTPGSAENPKCKSQSPYHRAKGRAPKGERYKCPYTNCKHEPFRNAGNFRNHMGSCHAESEYRNRHPADFLMPDLSPQPSSQGDGTSSVATNASDSPLSYRRPSLEFGTADLAAVASRDCFGGIGDDVYYAGHDGFRATRVQGLFDYGGDQEASATSGLTNGSVLEGIRFTPTDHQARPDVMPDNSLNDAPRFSPTQAGGVGFGQFQVMEEQGWGARREGQVYGE